MAATGLIAIVAQAQTLDAAKRAFDAGRYGEAASLFEAVRAKNPTCEIPFYLGLTRYRLRQPAEAIIAFQEAAKCDPGLTLAWVALGDAYTERNHEAEALAAYERALALEPQNTSALRGAAALYMRATMNDKAAAALEAVIRQDPRDEQAHADLGAVYFGSGDMDAAEKQFRLALQLNPKSAAALLGSGNVWLRRGDEEKAITELRQSISLSSKAAEPHFVLGSAYNRLGRFQEAAAELETAIRLGSGESEVYYHLARAYGGLGRPDDRTAALAKFAELSRKSKADTEARRQVLKLIARAKTLVEGQDLTGALTVMEQARDLRPADDTVLFRLASLDYDLGKYKEARNAIQEAIALAPSEWVYHYLLGLTEGRSGRLEQSRASLAVALRLNPSAKDVQDALREVESRLPQGPPRD